MNARWILCIAAGASALAALVAALPARAQVPVSIEGPISAVVLDPGSGNVTLSVLGIPVQVPFGTPIETPTANLTTAELADPALFPGRTQSGFVGGTAIIAGESASGVITADTVFVEPAENVLLGAVTENTQGPPVLKVEGVPVAFLADPRMPAEPPLNGFGFSIRLETVPVGTPASVEGYFADDGSGGVLHAFLFEADGGALVNAGIAEVSLLRAQCRNRSGSGRDEFSARGATHDPANGRVRLFDPRNGQFIGEASVARDAEFPAFGVYNFTSSRLTFPIGCPPLVRVVFVNRNASTVGEVAITE